MSACKHNDFREKARELVEHYAKTIELYDALLKTGDPRISRDTPERAQLVRTTYEILKALLQEQTHMLTLKRIQWILDSNFGEPYLPKGMVRTALNGEGDNQRLSIYIGRRDVQIDSDGKILGSGTSLQEKPLEPTALELGAQARAAGPSSY